MDNKNCKIIVRKDSKKSWEGLTRPFIWPPLLDDWIRKTDRSKTIVSLFVQKVPSLLVDFQGAFWFNPWRQQILLRKPADIEWSVLGIKKLKQILCIIRPISVLWITLPAAILWY